jgi:hypothetical protein
MLENWFGEELGSKCQRLVNEPPAPETLLVERTQPRLEVEAEFHGFGTRRDVMRAAEGGKEVVEHVLVR